VGSSFRSPLRAAQTAAHLTNHVIPRVPVRQWVITVPKPLRGFLADRSNAVAAVSHDTSRIA